MIEVTVQDAEIRVVPVDDKVVLRIIDEQMVFNICLAGVAVLELISNLTLQSLVP